MSSKYDFGFGDPVVIRQALGRHHEPIVTSMWFLDQLGYANKSGMPKLVDAVRDHVDSLIGRRYKHVFITPGAVGGINVTLRAFKATQFDKLTISHKRDATLNYHRPAFHYYREIMLFSGLSESPSIGRNTIALIDSPSNPTGEIRCDSEISQAQKPDFVIWDAAYHSPVYNQKLMHLFPKHDVMVGSLGKTFGLTGLRIGWAATNNDDYAKEIERSLHAEALSVSVPSQLIALNLLEYVNHEAFYKTAAGMLDDNREQFARLKRFFEVDVPESGMFYYAPINQIYLNDTLRRMGVKYIPGQDVEGSAEFGRFSLAQDRTLTKAFADELIRRLD